MLTIIFGAVITCVFSIISAVVGYIIIDKYKVIKERNNLARLTYGKEIAIQLEDGTYLKVDSNYEDNTLVGGSREIGAWNRFIIVAAKPLQNRPTKTIKDGDKVCFKARVKGEWKYVSVRLGPSDQKQLKARSDKLTSWQTFTICTTEENTTTDFHYNSPFALRACNGSFVTYNPREDDGKKRLLAIYGHTKKSETFFFINPNSFQ